VWQERFYVQKAWFGLIIFWSFVRIGTAELYFAKYGINIWAYALIEIVSSPILARSSSRMAVALKYHEIRQSIVWGGLTMVSFSAPDVYLLTAGRGLPWVAYGILLLLMTFAGTASVIKLKQKVSLQASLNRVHD
jgi:hypothetical protein